MNHCSGIFLALHATRYFPILGEAVFTNNYLFMAIIPCAVTIVLASDSAYATLPDNSILISKALEHAIVEYKQ